MHRLPIRIASSAAALTSATLPSNTFSAVACLMILTVTDDAALARGAAAAFTAA
jgi:hypothetical protein